MPGFLQLNASIGNLGFNAGINVGFGPGQQFRTQAVPNNQLTLYSLAIRAPGQAFGLISGYTFPISPGNIRKEFTALTNFYDVAGDPSQQGVQRIIDMYGDTPVLYTIEGTTGWKFHSTDGFSMTGLDSIRALESVFAQFAQLNQSITQGQQGQDLYSLEFYDYFRNDYWQVVPCGPQMIRQSRSRPLFVDYLFRLAGVQNLANPIMVTDPLASVFGQAPSQASYTVSNFGSGVTTNYGDVTIENIDLNPATP